MTPPYTRTDGCTYLLRLPRFSELGAAALKPGIERVVELLELFGRPDQSLRVVHVAGTNGKGSVASMIASIATASGLRTGLHTSPHLHSVTERFRIDGIPTPTDWLDDVVGRYRKDIEELQPSFFEATVALSLLYFVEMSVDLAVVEVGLGGRLDATNILDAPLAVITSIGLDHTELLGGSIEKIAGEKAGIIKRGQTVLSGALQPEARRILEEKAAAVGARLEHITDSCRRGSRTAGIDGSVLDLETPVARYAGLQIPLAGEHQLLNAALAVRAAEMTLPESAREFSIREGLRGVRRLSGLRGRLELLCTTPSVFADVAHNPDGLAAALDHISRFRKAESRLVVALSVMKDKDVRGMAQVLRAHGASARTVPLRSSRAVDPAELADILKAEGVEVDTAPGVRDALESFLRSAGNDDVLLLTGSYLVIEEALEFISAGLSALNA